jgi:hypothetical protein
MPLYAPDARAQEDKRGAHGCGSCPGDRISGPNLGRKWVRVDRSMRLGPNSSVNFNSIFMKGDNLHVENLIELWHEKMVKKEIPYLKCCVKEY